MIRRVCEEIKVKKCIKCGQEKPATTEYFYRETNLKLRNECIECRKSIYKYDENFDFDNWYNNKSDVFKNRWDYQDLKWVYDNYSEINKQVLLNKFSESNYKTITNIIYQWNIRKITKNDNWPDEDIQFLKDNYPSMSQDKLQERFSYRTWDAIKNKASKLNIQRDEETLFLIKSEAHKGHKVSEETKRKISRTRRGSNAVNWKGGLSPLHPYFRGILYEWKMDSLKRYNYKCVLTNENHGDLQIHHASENFSNIILETLNILDLPIYQNMLKYSDDEIKKINQTFLDLNYKYGLGIPLRKKIHKLFHIMYGSTDNNDIQFDEFKKRYLNGEFNEVLKTSEENMKNKKPNKKKYKRLKSEDVIKIRELLNKGFPITYISKEYGMGDTAIYNIKINKTWKNVG